MWFRRKLAVDVEPLRASLREAAAWCAVAVGDDPNAHLWTPGLLDIDIAADKHAAWRALYEPESAALMLSALRTRRAARLAPVSRASGPVAKGRVLVCELDCTVDDGASQAEAPGFIDISDVPAWDTWIGFLRADAVPLIGHDRRDPLLAWIPAPLVPRAQSAIEVNPTEVLTWLDTRNARLSRALLAPA